MFTLDDPEPLLLGDEPIWRDGVLVGRITSGAYAHTLGRSVGMGYVAHPDGVDAAFVRAGRWELELATGASGPPRSSSRRAIPPPRGCARRQAARFPRLAHGVAGTRVTALPPLICVGRRDRLLLAARRRHNRMNGEARDQSSAGRPEHGAASRPQEILRARGRPAALRQRAVRQRRRALRLDLRAGLDGLGPVLPPLDPDEIRPPCRHEAARRRDRHRPRGTGGHAHPARAGSRGRARPQHRHAAASAEEPGDAAGARHRSRICRSRPTTSTSSAWATRCATWPTSAWPSGNACGS